MKKKIKFLVIHSTDTPAGREVSADDIDQWHLGPADNKDGSVTYLGVKYPNRDALPAHKIGGVHIKKLKGRGWRRRGYRDMIHFNGGVEVITPHNDDEYVDEWEITNGVAGINQISAHVVIVGGKGKDTRTFEQEVSLKNYVKRYISRFPDLEVGGHYQWDKGKACPSFDVPRWLKSIGVSDKNIYKGKK